MIKTISILFIFLSFLYLAGCSSTQVRFAVMGDTPYYESDSELLQVTEALDEMAMAELPFVVHIGDIMRGRTKCERKLYEMRAGVFSKSPIPFLITIGDNEFNDCKYPVKSQALFREVILNNPPIHQRITGADENFEGLMVIRQQEMIENVAWSYDGVDFIMLVFPDLPGRYPLDEVSINTILNANKNFLVKYFKKAIKNKKDAVVLLMHSNPVTCNLSSCFDFVGILESEIKKFGKPVLLINGSNHSREFVSSDYLELPNLSHLRPGSEPEVMWPEVIFSNVTNIFTVKWHEASGEE